MITYETRSADPVTLRSAITYETKNTHPGMLPDATIHICGILCLSFDGAKKCTVGVPYVDQEHKWEFRIEDQDGNPLHVFKQGHTRANEFHIEVKGGTTGGAYVYNGNVPVSIPVTGEQRFNLESSWIDLEGSRGHNKPVKNNSNTLWPRFYINEGLFSASELSMGTYALKDSNHTPLIKLLDQVAVEMVADIFLEHNPDSKIEIKLSTHTISLDRGKRYQIYITHEMDSDVEPQEPDFHLLYNAFSATMKPNDRFHLVSHDGSKRRMTESAVAQTEDSIAILYYDKVPCMGATFGQTRAFKA